MPTRLEILQAITRARHTAKTKKPIQDVSYLQWKARQCLLHGKEIDVMTSILMADYKCRPKEGPPSKRRAKVVPVKEIDWSLVRKAAARI